MVNVGRPSRACLTCRRRKVKCDEIQPVCNRCTRLGVECEWKDQWSSLVRHQESWAERKVVQRVKRAQYQRGLRDGSHSESSSLQKLPNPVKILKQCQIRPEIFAVNRFFTDYAFDPATCPFLYAVRPMYELQESPEHLRNVVPATALANVAKMQRRQDLMAEAAKFYGRSLRHLAMCLNDREMAKQDSTMLTVYILGLYEAISFEFENTKPCPYHTHAPGRLALLRLRGREQMRTRLGRNMFMIVYHEHLIACLHGLIEPLGECLPWIYEAFPQSPLISLTVFMHDISCFLCRCRNALGRGRDAEVAELIALLEEGALHHSMALDVLTFYKTGEIDGNQAVFSCSSNDPRRRKQSRHANASPKERRKSTQLTGNANARATSKEKVTEDGGRELNWPQALEDVPCDILKRFDDVRVADYFQEYLGIFRGVTASAIPATHILLLSTLVKLAATIRCLVSRSPFIPPSSLEKLKAVAPEGEWISTVRQHALDIVGEVPRVLVPPEGQNRTPIFDKGRAFRAYMMVWYLKTACHSQHVKEETRRKIRTWLEYIGNKYGIGMAFAVENKGDAILAEREWKEGLCWG